VLSGAQAASAATPHAPSWHPALSVPGPADVWTQTGVVGLFPASSGGRFALR
jgi:hypothetical protein